MDKIFKPGIDSGKIRTRSPFAGAMPAEEMGLGKAPGVDILADLLRDEIAAVSKVPVIEVARNTT